MDPSLLEKLAFLSKVIGSSPYLLEEIRNHYETEIQILVDKLLSGALDEEELDKALFLLNKEAAFQEIESLIKKIRFLNPSSPRLENLKGCLEALAYGRISPEQARAETDRLMGK